MERTIFDLQMVVEVIVIGGLMLLYPRITRRGLLFGVYVGEERSAGAEARNIVGGWNRGAITATCIALAVAVALALSRANPLLTAAPTLLLALASVALYLRSYRRARSLAPEPGARLAAASILAEVPGGTAIPVLVLLAGVLCGTFAVAYTEAHYGGLPDRVPTHFGTSGRPDAWSRKGFASVMIMPVMTLIMGVLLGGVTVLTSRAKRAVRLDAGGGSLDAQNRFRGAITRYLAVLSLLVILLLTTMSITSVQVGLGRREGLPPAMLLLGIGLAAFAMIGAVWLAIRYGQGGSRLEGPAAAAPLTNGLADNRAWRLGVFYVNPDDPSWMVEKRFGFGYTLNFGNRKAVATLSVLFGAVIGLAIWAIAAL
jgi:uncharacterized membrane protein